MTLWSFLSSFLLHLMNFRENSFSKSGGHLGDSDKLAKRPSWSIWPRNVVKHLVQGQRCLWNPFLPWFQDTCFSILEWSHPSRIWQHLLLQCDSYPTLGSPVAVLQTSNVSQVHARISNGFPEVRLLTCRLRTKLLAPLGYNGVAGKNLGFYPT